jgi:hypothetical protein
LEEALAVFAVLPCCQRSQDVAAEDMTNDEVFDCAKVRKAAITWCKRNPVAARPASNKQLSDEGRIPDLFFFSQTVANCTKLLNEQMLKCHPLGPREAEVRDEHETQT